MAAGDVRDDSEPRDRRAWRRSNWIEVILTPGFLLAVAAMDWVLNGGLEFLGMLGLGAAGGLIVGAVLRVRRRRSWRA